MTDLTRGCRTPRRPSRRILARRYIVHPRAARPRRHHATSASTVAGRALEHGLDGAVGPVADPARHPPCARFARARRAEEHALHPARHRPRGPVSPSGPRVGSRACRATTARRPSWWSTCRTISPTPQGSLYVPGGDVIVDEVNAEVARAQAAGAHVVYTQDWHPPATPHFVTDGGIWPVHCVEDTWGAAFHPRLVVDGAVGPQGPRRRRRLLGVQRPRPAERRRPRHDPRRAPARPRGRRARGRGPGHGLLRRRDRLRRADARLPGRGGARRDRGGRPRRPATATGRSRGCATPASSWSDRARLSSGTAGSRTTTAARCARVSIGVRHRRHGRPARP